MKAFGVKEVEALKAFFEKTKQPGSGVKLSECETIADVSKFISTGIQMLSANVGNPTFNPYYNRLLKLKQLIQKNQIEYVELKPEKVIPIKTTPKQIEKPKPKKRKK